MALLTFVLGVLALGAMLSFVIHAAWALRHLSGKYSLLQMFWGARGWDAENYSPRGQQLHQRFVGSFLAFFVFALAMVATHLLWPR